MLQVAREMQAECEPCSNSLHGSPTMAQLTSNAMVKVLLEHVAPPF